jgi:hypothetical protein
MLTSVAQARRRGDIDRLEWLAGLVRPEHRGLAALATCLGPRTEAGGLKGRTPPVTM